MQRIGCSLILKATGVEVLALGMGPVDFDVPGELTQIRGGADVGWQNDTHKLVERWQTGAPPNQWCSQTGQTVAFDGTKTVVTLLFSAVADIVPQSITMMQARLALNATGQLAAINGLIAGGSVPVQLMWEYSGVLDRQNVSLLAVAALAGLTSADVDNLFRAASVL